MTAATDKLPPLVDVLENADRFGLSGIYEFRIGLELYGDYLDRDDVLRLAAPYDALIRQQEARIAELEAENAKLRDELAVLNHDFAERLAQFRELAKRAASFAVGIDPDNLGTAVKAILDELAAMHMEATDG